MAEHDDTHGGVTLADPGRRAHTLVRPRRRHADVGDDHVGLGGVDDLEQLVERARDTDDLELRLGIDQSHHALPEQVVVVSDDDPHGHGQRLPRHRGYAQLLMCRPSRGRRHALTASERAPASERPTTACVAGERHRVVARRRRTRRPCSRRRARRARRRPAAGTPARRTGHGAARSSHPARTATSTASVDAARLRDTARASRRGRRAKVRLVRAAPPTRGRSAAGAARTLPATRRRRSGSGYVKYRY